MDTQFITDLHEMGHTEFVQEYNAPVSLKEFYQMRAQSADAYVALTAGVGSGGAGNILRYGNNVLPTVSSASGGAVAVGDDLGPSVATLIASLLMGQDGLPLMETVQNSVVLNAELPLTESISSAVVIGHKAADTTVTLQNSVVIGHSAGEDKRLGTNCTLVGHNTQVFEDDDVNSIVIGSQAVGSGPNTSTFGTVATTDNFFFGNARFAGGGVYADKAIAMLAANPSLTSAATIAPTALVSALSGTTDISTITPPAAWGGRSGILVLVVTAGSPDFIGGGNIVNPKAVVSGNPYLCIYLGTAGAWYILG